MKKFILLLFFFTIAFIPEFINAQIKLDVKASFNNLLRYGSGEERTGANAYHKEYFEDLADGRLTINDITFGLRYEISAPIEYGVDYRGIRKRFIEYNNVSEGVNVRAGDFWDIIGRGLTMNVFEDRALFYDTGIDGIKAFYKHTFGDKNPVKVKAQISGGMLNYNDFAIPTRVETYNVRDINFELSPVKFINFGFNYVYANGRIPNITDTTGIDAYLPEGYMTVNYKGLQLFASYAHKHVNTNTINTSYPVFINSVGDGFYGSVSYSLPKLGITLDYKNYRFDITDPQNRANDRPTKLLPFQNPPTVVKEHSTTLVSRNPHIVDFNDEVGAQLDIVYAPKDEITFNINASVASRHYDYYRSIENNQIVYRRIDRTSNFIPSFDNSFSPYWEIYADGEYYINDKWYVKAAFDRQNLIISSQTTNLTEIKKINTIPTEIRYSITPEYSVKFIAEHQFVYDNIRYGDKNYMNTLLSLTFSKSPKISATVNYEFTNDDEEITGRKNWALAEVAYKFNPSNTLTVSYGTERGGLRCTNGICRLVKPFDGFRLTLNTKF